MKTYYHQEEYMKCIILSVVIAVIAVVCYSPGLLNLRPSDSFFRAGMSIIIGFCLVLSFVVGNYLILHEPKKTSIRREDVKTSADAMMILRQYKDGKAFGSIATTAIEQLKRLDVCVHRATVAIKNRFEDGSLSYSNYLTGVSAAEETALKNVVAMTNRMMLFDEDEYERLKHYKTDNIPDDIQEQQIELYKRNLDIIKETISLNEKILLNLDTLTLEISSINKEQNADSSILDELERLSKEAKYYQ